MSAVAAESAIPAAVAAPVKGGKKKLLVMGVVALLVLALTGAGLVMFLKSKAARAAEAADADEEVATAMAHPAGKADPAHPPTFLPLEPFVVNLADKDADRYAQVGIVLEVDNAPFAEQMKAYMPAIRNAILMILAHKSSKELLERSGKEQLAAEIMRETVRPMGIEIAAPEPIEQRPAEGSEAEPRAVPKKAKGHKAGPHNPVRHVHFSNFIVQ